MIHVPFLIQRRHATIQNRFVAMRASHAEQLLVAFLAVRQVVLFVEIVGAEGVLTITTDEVLRVVSVAQRLNDFAEDGVLASCAGAARGRTTAVYVFHLRGEVFEQVVEIIADERLSGRFRTA
jgi:hypothetical protein